MLQFEVQCDGKLEISCHLTLAERLRLLWDGNIKLTVENGDKNVWYRCHNTEIKKQKRVDR